MLVTMTTDIQHPLPEGTLVRLTRADGGYPEGFEFVIDEYVEPRPLAEREHADEITEPIYYGNANGGGGNVCVDADAVKVVRTAAEMDARTYPGKCEIASQIASELMGDFDTFETDETFSPENADWVEVYGRTFEGLTFGFRVQVTRVWETDL